MQPLSKIDLTPEEYLAIERQAQTKAEAHPTRPGPPVWDR